jgi:hypothetical protein
MRKKKKLLWIGDDLRMHSGVATQLRELVLGLVDEYDICSIAGAMQHPEHGKVIDLSDSTKQMTGVQDAYVRLYPINGYGDENVLFTIINQEKPDAVCMITDPRFYGWLFALEKQVRMRIPIVYWALWDCVPYPMWNRSGYMSCDGIFAISKQSNNIHKCVISPELCCSLDGEFDNMGNLIKK